MLSDCTHSRMLSSHGLSGLICCNLPECIHDRRSFLIESSIAKPRSVKSKRGEIYESLEAARKPTPYRHCSFKCISVHDMFSSKASSHVRTDARKSTNINPHTHTHTSNT